MRPTETVLRAAVLSIAGLCIALGACALQPPTPWPLTELARSPLGSVTAPAREVVREAATWTRRWHALQRSAAPTPAVDFDQQMVLIAVMGERRTGGYAIEIIAVEIDAGELVVAVRETGPPPGAITTQMLTAPFHAVRVARSDLPVRWVDAP